MTSGNLENKGRPYFENTKVIKIMLDVSRSIIIIIIIAVKPSI